MINSIGKQLVWTAGINEAVAESKEFAKFIVESLKKFSARNWGETCAEDSVLNDEACKAWDKGDYLDRVVAKYVFGDDKIFIITEYDRSVTTVLFTHEY
jgi:hypothetical protein